MQLDRGQFWGWKNQEISAEGFWLSLTDYKPLSRQPLHTHSNPTFFLQLKGDHRDETASATRIQPPLTINFHPTTVPHRSDVGPAGMWGINLEVSPAWLGAHQLEERDLGSLRILQDAQTCCGLARFAAHAFGAAGHTDLDLLVFELVALFTSFPSAVESSPPKWLNQVRRSILDQLPRKAVLTKLAGEAGVHPVYLCRSFRRHFGQSVSEFVGASRVAEACRLLLEGMDAGRVALECGFADQFHLSRTMSKSFGTRPRDLKRVAALMALPDKAPQSPSRFRTYM